MEFWAISVKAGESLQVKLDLFNVIHISQAAIGEAKHVPLHLGENSYVKLYRLRVDLS